MIEGFAFENTIIALQGVEIIEFVVAVKLLGLCCVYDSSYLHWD